MLPGVLHSMGVICDVVCSLQDRFTGIPVSTQTASLQCCCAAAAHLRDEMSGNELPEPGGRQEPVEPLAGQVCDVGVVQGGALNLGLCSSKSTFGTAHVT